MERLKDEKQKDDETFLKIARERFTTQCSRDNHNRVSARENLRFVYNIDNGQWPDDVKAERAEAQRPCLTSNKLRKFVSQVANRERDQRIAGNVRPVDDKGDVEKARIISGIIRQIEHASGAEKIYTSSGEQAIAGGFGYWRIVAEEVADSFDQELFLKGIKNPLNVYLDPDRMYGFVREKITKDEFKRKYPRAREEEWNGDDSVYEEWYSDDDKLYIAEYYYKEKVDIEIVQAVNDLTADVNIFELNEKITEEMLIEKGYRIEKRKKKNVFKVKWAKITATQVLDKGEWVGKEIPIIEVEGDWVWIDGKVYKRSLTIDAHDDQRMYNYWKTNITETVALAIKAPYLVTVNMIKGLKSYWDVAHKKLMAYLPYKPQGNLTPRREPPPQVPTGADRMLMHTGRDIQDTIGMYESSFGERGNERTGIAIQSRANRSDFSTFQFPDNFRRAILESTKQLIDCIPKIYDTPRIVRILGEDGVSEEPADNVAAINQPVILADGTAGVINDITVGKYDVVEDVKIMSTRRQEQLQGMIDLAKGSPQLSLLIAPHVARLSDWDGHKEIAKEIKEVVPAILGIQPQKHEGEQMPPGAIPGQ